MSAPGRDDEVVATAQLDGVRPPPERIVALTAPGQMIRRRCQYERQ